MRKRQDLSVSMWLNRSVDLISSWYTNSGIIAGKSTWYSFLKWDDKQVLVQLHLGLDLVLGFEADFQGWGLSLDWTELKSHEIFL